MNRRNFIRGILAGAALATGLARTTLEPQGGISLDAVAKVKSLLDAADVPSEGRSLFVHKFNEDVLHGLMRNKDKLFFGPRA